MSTRRAAILACSTLMALSACTGSSPATSSSPSASASASVEPSMVASAEPSPTPAALPQLGEVTVDSLPLFDAPGGSGAPAASLPNGAAVLLVESADDPSWVWVVSLDGDLTDELEIPFGWTQEQSGATTQIMRVAPDCPGSPVSYEAFQALEPADGLVCFGDEPIEVVGYLVEGCGSGASPRSGEPDWLNGTFSSVPVAGTAVGSTDPVPADIIFLRASPGVSASSCAGTPADWYQFAGHFDDPASSTCQTTTSSDGTTMEEVEPALSIVLCRMRYAITGLTATTPP